MRKEILVFALFFCAVLLGGCRGVESCPAADPSAAPEETTETALFLTEPNNWEGDAPQAVIDLIEDAGHQVSRISTDPSILHGQRYHMELDGDKLHAVAVYRYGSAADAAAEAACVGTDGYSFVFPLNEDEVSIVEVNWTDTPHFYLNDDLIILYIGQDKALTSAFEAAFGAPFAGVEVAGIA